MRRTDPGKATPMVKFSAASGGSWVVRFKRLATDYPLPGAEHFRSTPYRDAAHGSRQSHTDGEVLGCQWWVVGCSVQTTRNGLPATGSRALQIYALPRCGARIPAKPHRW